MTTARSVPDRFASLNDARTLRTEEAACYLKAVEHHMKHSSRKQRVVSYEVRTRREVMPAELELSPRADTCDGIGQMYVATICNNSSS